MRLATEVYRSDPADMSSEFPTGGSGRHRFVSGGRFGAPTERSEQTSCTRSYTRSCHSRQLRRTAEMVGLADIQRHGELDTASRPIAAPMRDQLECGWTPTDPEHNMPGHDLGYTRYDKMARRWASTPNMSKSPR
jgi:hypothetical protein